MLAERQAEIAASSSASSIASDSAPGSAQTALKQANRRAEDLRAAAAAAEARERDSAAQVDRANGIIERLTVRKRSSSDVSPLAAHGREPRMHSTVVDGSTLAATDKQRTLHGTRVSARTAVQTLPLADRETSASRRRRHGGGQPS